MSFSDSVYRTLFEEDPEALLVVDPESGHIRECNRRFCELVDSNPEAVRSRDLSALVTSPHGPSDGVLADVRTGGSDDDHLVWQLRPDTGPAITAEARLSSVADGAYVLVRISPMTGSGGELQGCQHLAEAIQEAPIGVTISDPARDDNPLVYANERFREVTGYQDGEIIGSNCRFLQGPDTGREPVRRMRDAIAAEEPVTVELRNYRKDGSEFWNRVTIAPVYDEAGRLRHFVGFQDDISDRKQSEEELELAQHLLETVPSGVLRTAPSPDGTFEYVNPALVSILDAESPEQLRDRRVADVYVDPGQRRRLVEALRTTDRERVTHEVAFRTLDGERREVAVTATLTEDETGTEHLHKVVRDITNRREREGELERYERLVENLPIGVYRNTPGPDGEFRFLNGAMAEMFDAGSADRLREHDVGDLYVNPDEREEFSRTLREQGVVTEKELELVTLEGREIWGSVTAIRREVDGEVVFDGVIQDVSARKRYQQRLEEQRDNLDMMNQMLRHDIRNDLQLVTAYADVLTDHVDEAGRGYLDTIQESAAHAVEITETARDLSDVMRSSDDASEAIDLRPTLQEEVDDVRAEYANAAITVDGTIPECSVEANEMLRSVFRNLLTNAIQHNDKEVPEVHVAASRNDRTVTVRIADNGPGVPDSQKETIFGKGEKGVDSGGTGIGLYLVRELVDVYGGTVRVADNDPEGAVFVIALERVK